VHACRRKENRGEVQKAYTRKDLFPGRGSHEEEFAWEKADPTRKKPRKEREEVTISPLFRRRRGNRQDQRGIFKTKSSSGKSAYHASSFASRSPRGKRKWKSRSYWEASNPTTLPRGKRIGDGGGRGEKNSTPAQQMGRHMLQASPYKRGKKRTAVLREGGNTQSPCGSLRSARGKERVDSLCHQKGGGAIIAVWGERKKEGE